MNRKGKRGFEGKMYVSTDWDGTEAGIATATWEELDNVRNVTSPGAKDAIEDTRKGSGNKTYDTGLLDMGFTAEMKRDKTHAGYNAVRTAWKTDALIGVALFDGPMSDTTSEGEAAIMGVFSFSGDQNLDSMMDASVEFKPNGDVLIDPTLPAA